MELVNKVAQSGIETISLDAFMQNKAVVAFDIKDFLVMELVLREKAFRESLKAHDWSIYQDKTVAVFCSVDTLIPRWAYMLVASYLQDVAQQVSVGTLQFVQEQIAQQQIAAFDWSIYQGKNVVVKGCGNQVSEAAYLSATLQLQKYAKKIMYGEPCSAVPIWRK